MQFENEAAYWKSRALKAERALELECENHARTSELMMTGEALRAKLMVKAILSGAFNELT